MSPHLLIVEDDSRLNQMLLFGFEEQGYTAVGVRTCADAVAALRRHSTDLVLLDHQLPDGTGLDLLRTIKGQDPDLPVIMITGSHDLDLAIEAIKSGASDFVHKPIKSEALEHAVARVIEMRRLAREVIALQPEAGDLVVSGDLIGRSEAMLDVSKEIALSAGSGATVLITGESGTGKEVVARLIHMHSGRTGPFVAVNCAAIVENLLESELFGHERGAFTGASARKPGKFELAQDGTLFLDEIGELAPPLQAKLLRALQERVVERVGGTQQIQINARVIAATNRDLGHEAATKRFREDLLYRLNVITIHLPPLRDRREDIPLLVRALTNKIARTIHKPAFQVSPQALELLRRYDWPGNVRELENVLTQAMVHARSGVLTPDLLSLGTRSGWNRPDAVEKNEPAHGELCTLEQLEASHIQRVLDHTAGHKGASCAILGISRPALDRKIRKYRLRLPAERLRGRKD